MKLHHQFASVIRQTYKRQELFNWQTILCLSFLCCNGFQPKHVFPFSRIIILHRYNGRLLRNSLGNPNPRVMFIKDGIRTHGTLYNVHFSADSRLMYSFEYSMIVYEKEFYKLQHKITLNFLGLKNNRQSIG